MTMTEQDQLIGRASRAPGRPIAALVAAMLFVLTGLSGAVGAMAATKALPATDEDLVETIETAIAARDYGAFEDLVYWEGAGKIKRRIVAFEIRRGLGRKIERIALEDFPKDGLAKVEAMPQLRVNMPVTHRVRVTYDEPPINDQGKLPTSVFLVGKKDGAYRIALVVRDAVDDDD
jgi:hypothetical protein